MTALVPAALLVGLLIGAFAGVLFTRSTRDASLAHATADATRHAENARIRAETELGAARRDREAEIARAAQAQHRADEAVAEAASVRITLASVRAALEAERAATDQREQAFAKREAELRQSFQALSAEALAKNNETFVQLAEARIREATSALNTKAENDATVRHKAIEAMLNPVSQTLTRVEGQLRAVEKEREAAYAGLREQVLAMHRTSTQLQGETKQLVNALRAPQVRGRWGELQLERIVELAGMVEHCDFDRQVSTTHAGGDSDNRLRPDLVVNLAGEKQIVIDAKVPFAAFLQAIDAGDPDVHAERMKAHARHLRSHVDALAAKAYWQSFETTPEFVVLFVPGDPFLEAALQADSTLLEHAFEHNVVIATPTTLIALLRTVAYTWRQEALARNAAQVHTLGKELHSRIATMGGHVAKLGRALSGAVDSYNSTVGTLESRVLVTARKFVDMKLLDDELETPAQVEKLPRHVQAPELVASAEDDLVCIDEPRELPQIDPRYSLFPEPPRLPRRASGDNRS